MVDRLELRGRTFERTVPVRKARNTRKTTTTNSPQRDILTPDDINSMAGEELLKACGLIPAVEGETSLCTEFDDDEPLPELSSIIDDSSDDESDDESFDVTPPLTVQAYVDFDNWGTDANAQQNSKMSYNTRMASIKDNGKHFPTLTAGKCTIEILDRFQTACENKAIQRGIEDANFDEIAVFNEWIRKLIGVDKKIARLRALSKKLFEAERAAKKPRTNNAGGSSDGNRTGRRADWVPNLTEDEKDILGRHGGCFKCRQFYAGHRWATCPNGYPSLKDYKKITPQMAADAKKKRDNATNNTSASNGKAVAAVLPSDDFEYEDSSSEESGGQDVTNSPISSLVSLYALYLSEPSGLPFSP
ncbi:hypothetical protein CC2G_005202 [Coprinopsis cinerea AmutBmut pab1-1]|nr:hypothetical protein CC2G_005202 [Coprinopsis cinerea AmutBmut pab1-1]